MATLHSAPARRLHYLLWLANLPALPRLGLALALGGLCAWLAPADFLRGTRCLAAWDGFCAGVLGLTWGTIATADAAHIRRVATHQDPGRTWMFVASLLGAMASLLAVGVLLSGLPHLPRAHLLVSVGAVASLWLLLHTLFTLRYAHLYYSEDKATLAPDKLGGLDFPDAPPTTYWNFAYFAFVVGMTAQTSDTNVTSLRMRQLVLAHGLLSLPSTRPLSRRA